jgi:hypothetical protein
VEDPLNFGHGAHSAGNSAYADMMDEFSLFDRALSARKIADLSQRQAGP